MASGLMRSLKYHSYLSEAVEKSRFWLTDCVRLWKDNLSETALSLLTFELTLVCTCVFCSVISVTQAIRVDLLVMRDI